MRTLDLFCGGGGSSYGARMAGAEIVCGVDASPVATAVFKANFPSARAVTLEMTDRTTVRDLGRRIGPIDLLLASPECTHHTCARGSAPRDEASRATARYVLNFTTALTPRWVVVENVVHMRSWEGYQPLLEALERVGYHLRVEVLDSSRFGVPQSRRRLFIIGDRERPPSRIPLRPGPPQAARRIIDPAGTWDTRPLHRNGRAGATLVRATAGMNMLGCGNDFLVVYYGSDGNGGWQSLDKPLRTITTLDRFGLVTWVGMTPMLRMLQPPELQRGMGFREDYSLEAAGSRRERIRILGNGVAPPVMAAIIQALSTKNAVEPELPLNQTRFIKNIQKHETGMLLAAD